MKLSIMKMLLMGFLWLMGVGCVVGQRLKRPTSISYIGTTISSRAEIDSVIKEISLSDTSSISEPNNPISDTTIFIRNINIDSRFSLDSRITKSKLHFEDVNFLTFFSTGFTKFKFETLFKDVSFNNPHFVESNFRKKIQFLNCTFKTLKFVECNFENSLKISNSNFEDGLRFERTPMPDTLFFYNNRFSKDMDFTKVQYSKSKCKIFLTENNYSDISKLIIPSDRFTLGFEKIMAEYSFESEGYLFVEIPFEYKASTYEQIIKKCQSLGMTESLQGWTIEYKQVKNLHNYGKVLGGAWNWLQNTWWGYGYERQRIVYCAFLLFFMFSIINIFLLNSLLREVYFDADINKNFFPKHINTADKLLGHLRARNRYRTFFNKFTYSLHYTGIIYFGLKVKHESLNTKTPWVLYFYFVYLIGIIHLAGIAAYILK